MPGRLNAINNRHANQTENTDPYPLWRRVEQIRSGCQSDDQDDIAEHVNRK